MEKDIFRDRALFSDMEMNFMVVCDGVMTGWRQED